MRTPVFPGLAVLILPAAGLAQNRQADLAATMQAIAQALGVTCNYCHSAEPGSGQPEPKKDTARQMMAMTREINARVRQAAGGAATEVQCVTCHRGVPIPRQLPDILARTLAEKGAAEAVAQYRDLRARFHGRQAYDFGEETLLALGQRLTTSKPDDAIALLKLNLEFHPRSARTLAAIAYAYTRKFDDQTAISYLEKAVEIEPDNGVIAGQLVQLKSYRRRK
jgi:tetratricopeptide (TPR) repeat protein